MKRFKFTAVMLSLLIIATGSLVICNAMEITAGLSKDPESWCSSTERLDFSNTAGESLSTVKLGNKTFLPLEPVSKVLGLKLEAQKNGEFALSTDEGIIRGKAGSTEVIVNDKKQYLPLPVMKIENRLFVPDQFVKQCLNAAIYYNEKNLELIIKKDK